MTTITIPRSGDAPLKFRGERIAHFDGERFAGREQNRWYEIALYRVRDDRYVVHVGFRSRWQGESGRDDCYQGGASEIRAALKDHDPIPERVGFPAGEQYRERQAALVSALREQYAAAVREILSRDEFAVSLEEAQDDEYAALDREAILDFVRVQIADFGLTRAEACALCDANNGALLLGAHWWLSVGANIADTPAKALSAKWNCDAERLARRVLEADRGTLFALAYAAAQFWRHSDRDTDEALSLAGFVCSES